MAQLIREVAGIWVLEFLVSGGHELLALLVVPQMTLATSDFVTLPSPLVLKHGHLERELRTARKRSESMK